MGREAMDQVVDYRQQRGLQIAAMSKITRKGSAWLVPSQSGKGRYTVCPDREKPHCTCPDHETRGGKCKHIFAVEYVMTREILDDGSTTLTERLTVHKVRRTYPQDWRAYNKAQTHEKEEFLELLQELCAGVPEPQRAATGRPSVPLHDAIFAACFKVYTTLSARRFMSDLRMAHEKGFVSKAYHFNSVLKCLENPQVTQILYGLISESSMPLVSFEKDFAVDSTGFTSSRFIRWFDHQYGPRQGHHEWVKVHLMCGVRTHIVTAVAIKHRDASDTKLLPELVKTTAENFSLSEVSADKGYGSLQNYDVITSRGAVPYIAFKSIHTGRGGGVWEQMYHYFMYNRDEYMRHYHKRSNVESVFSMIKAKFRDHVRSKSDVAMINESLCKIICHNICCLIQARHELGASASFWRQKAIR
jgi:transposase